MILWGTEEAEVSWMHRPSVWKALEDGQAHEEKAGAGKARIPGGDLVDRGEKFGILMEDRDNVRSQREWLVLWVSVKGPPMVPTSLWVPVGVPAALLGPGKASDDPMLGPLYPRGDPEEAPSCSLARPRLAQPFGEGSSSGVQEELDLQMDL